LVDFLAALFALFFKLLKLRHHRSHQLNNNRGRNIRHDTKGKNTHPTKRAAREHGEHATDAALRLLHKFAQRGAINTWNGNKRPKAVNHQQAQSK